MEYEEQMDRLRRKYHLLSEKTFLDLYPQIIELAPVVESGLKLRHWKELHQEGIEDLGGYLSGLRSGKSSVCRMHYESLCRKIPGDGLISHL